MKGSKLYSILEYFNKYEQNRLRKFLQSPYFNKNERLVVLFDYLAHKINTESEKGLEKERIWKKLYPDKKYDDVRYRKLISELLKLVESFLAQEHYQENPLYQATYLLEAVSRRKMDKLYKSSMRTARRLSTQQPYKPGSYYFYQYQVEKSYQELTEHEHDRTSKRNYEEILENLDKFYIAEKLRYYCSILSHQAISSHIYEFLFRDEILQHLEIIDYDSVPPIAIYYQISLSQIQPTEEKHYFELKRLINKHSELFHPNEAEYIYHLGLNYCIRKINTGNQKFLQEYFELYQELIKRELIFTDGELSPWNFKNIITIALKLGEYKWTETFINDFSDKIPLHFRENAVSFNLAQLHFKTKNYEKVIELLHRVEYEDFTYNLNSKNILIMTYYEIDEIEPLDSLLESFRAYLNRQKKQKNFPETRLAPYRNLIRFTKKLTKTLPSDKTALKKLREEIDSTGNVASARWLKEKIAELE